MTQSRQTGLRRRLKDLELDAFVSRHAQNRRYLSGFTGSEGWIVVLKDKSYLCVDFRYLEQAAIQAPDCEIVRLEPQWTETLKLILGSMCRKVGFEAQWLTYEDYDKLNQCLSETSLVPTRNLVESLRVIKDEEEIAILRRAIAIADEGADFLFSRLSPGKTEREIAFGLEVFMRERGADGPAFPFIVASGQRGALPHGIASEKIMTTGEMVTVDFGAKYEGYHSDLTRTFMLGNPTDKQLKIYDIVLQAQSRAVSVAGPGIPCSEVDKAARDTISAAGYGDFFGHATGHGVGLSIHEDPRLSPGSDGTLLPGMVVTIEPGIYIPDWGGVRIEDVLLITNDGIEILSRAPKDEYVL